MLKKRNAQNMSIALMIAVVIGLIVLVVVLAIFGKGTGESAKTLQSCEARGGTCTEKGEVCSGATIRNVECPTTEPKCCLNI